RRPFLRSICRAISKPRLRQVNQEGQRLRSYGLLEFGEASPFARAACGAWALRMSAQRTSFLFDKRRENELQARQYGLVRAIHSFPDCLAFGFAARFIEFPHRPSCKGADRQAARARAHADFAGKSGTHGNNGGLRYLFMRTSMNDLSDQAHEIPPTESLPTSEQARMRKSLSFLVPLNPSLDSLSLTKATNHFVN